MQPAPSPLDTPPPSPITSPIPLASKPTREATTPVLLLEDDPVDARRVQRDLAASGRNFDVTWVRTLREAIAVLSRSEFSALLTDLDLPDSRHFETVRRLRACESELPMLVLTSSSDDETALGSLKSGAQEFLAKDEFTPNQLVRMLLLAIARAAEENGCADDASKPPLRFANFELDRQEHELRRGGKPVEIKRKPLELLTYLAEHSHRAVPKEELLAAVWHDQLVTDTALSTALKQLRRALGDDGQSMHVIRTERGRGYRFIPDVEEGSPDPARVTGGRARSTAAQMADPCDPNAAEAFLEAQYHAERLHFENAVECFGRALDSEPEHVLSRTGFVASALMASAHASSIRACELRAQAHAIAAETVLQWPEVGRAHNAQAMVHLFEWRWEEARREFSLAIEREPEYPWNHLYLADALAILGRRGEAAERCQRAIACAPTQIEVRFFAGLDYRHAGCAREATEELELVARMEPRFRPTYRGLWELYLDQRRDAEAIGAYLRLGGSQREDLWELFDREGIDAVLEAALTRLEERLPHSHFERGVLCARLGRVCDALEHIDEAIDHSERAVGHLGCEPALSRLCESGALDDRLRRLGLDRSTVAE